MLSDRHRILLDDKATGIGYFETFIRYVFNAGLQLTKDDINKIIYKIKTTYPGGSDTIMTLAPANEVKPITVILIAIIAKYALLSLIID